MVVAFAVGIDIACRSFPRISLDLAGWLVKWC
jgi:hypothetical protein